MSSHLGWSFRDRTVDFSRRAQVMGIVNVTPDSFSDGGKFLDPQKAISHGLELVREGAEILDLGGESSRPGAAPITVEEELARIVPVVRGLAAVTQVTLSIDTTKAAVAAAALEAGAHVINDITALRGDPELADVVREHGAGVILMHMQGTPQTMQLNPNYLDVVQEVVGFLGERIQFAMDQGIARERIAVDPGIGFGKTSEHNVQLLARLPRLMGLSRPVCLGVSRKNFLGRRLGRSLEERLPGSLAVAGYALGCRSAQILRVHDVAATWDVVRIFHELQVRAETP